MKSYCIKIENINMPHEFKSTRVIDATTIKDLFNKICQVYGFSEKMKTHLELWSGPLGYQERMRLDNLEIIPEKYEHIWVRATCITHHHP